MDVRFRSFQVNWRVRVFILAFLILIIFAPLLLSSITAAPRYQVSASQGSTSKEVVIVNLNVPIDQGSSGLMSRAIGIAHADGAAAVIVDMNTPGGILQDMLSMVNSISNSTASGIPVYTYVPNDSLAASAGSYIAMSTVKIFMGPGSQIGPSTPIVVGGTTLEQNHTEDAMLTLMTSLAQENGRNVTAATQMVLYDIAYSYSDALRYHIADASSISMGQTLQMLNLTGASLVTVSENPTEQLLSFLSNPTVDGILLLVGIIAISLDFLHPTIILSVAGAILLALALIGAETIQSGSNSSAIALPLVLFAAAAILIVFEIKTGHGFMLFAGVIVGAIATSLLAYEVPYSPAPVGAIQYIELGVFIAIGGLLALYARWVGGTIRRKPVTGVESIVGKIGVVTSNLNPTGEVSVDGIIWKSRLAANSDTAAIKGDRVRVVRVVGLTLEVEPESIKEKTKPPTTG